MIVNVIEIFTEYLSVIFCVHRIAKKKITLDKYVWMFFLLDLFSILLAHKYREEHGWLMMVTYINFFVYVKMRINKKWTEAIKVFSIMLIMIPSLQMIIYFSIKYALNIADSQQVKGTIVNCIICILVFFWKNEYIFLAAKRIIKSSEILIFIVLWWFLAYLLLIYKQSDFLSEQLSFQSFASIVGIGTIFILWVNAENERRNKAKELKLYELYNKTFEEAIAAIRIRQHEFDNHINAIKCLQYTIDDSETLLKAQNEYCDKVLNENSFNRLLKLHTEPILTGFLYSKLMNAKEQDIMVLHEVHEIDIKKRIEVSLIVEIIGIFIDNAIEALLSEKNDNRTLIVKILQEDKGIISIEVANSSRKYLNSEIEKFSVYGYSTKGKNRGSGLARAKEIAKRSKGDFFIENVLYNGRNYLSFKIIFKFDK